MELKLSETKKKILHLLAIKERTWKELKEETNLSDPVLAKHIKELLKMNLITEKIDPNDRRRKIYRLAPNSLESLKDELISFNLFIWLLSNINEYAKVYSKKGEYTKYVEEVQKLIGSVFFICHPHDIQYFAEATGYLSVFLKPQLTQIRKLVVDEEAEFTFSKIKKAKAEELLKDVVVVLKGMMKKWLCLNRTTPDEMRSVLSKFFEGEALEIALKIWEDEKRNSEHLLNTLKETWIYHLIKIEESEIPTFEELVKLAYLKEGVTE